jgi:23S rRNA-/tRNA-specific pseudouridylate synthase
MNSRQPAIEVLWDGEAMIAVNKPAGLSTQAPPGGDSLEARLRVQLASRSDYLAFPHRLDRPVSGIVLVALRKRAAKLLSEQFASRKVDKEYLAMVVGKVQTHTQTWTHNLRKLPDQARAEVVTDDAGESERADARPAETKVELLHYDTELDRSELRLLPVTGRMHQLRVQSAYVGHPILGDTLYGGPPLTEAEMAGFSERILLQAHSITFFDPRNGVRTTVTASDKFGQSV